MKASVRLVLSFIVALSSMFSLAPREAKAREAAIAPQEYQTGMARHFEAVWGYLGKAVEKHA